MSLKLTPRGKQTLEKFDLLAKSSPELARRILTEYGAASLKAADKLVPIDSGSLRSTGRLKTNKTKNSVSIIFGGIMAKFSKAGRQRNFVDYARYVEEGTSRFSGRHFLLRGMMMAFSNLNKITLGAFNQWVSRIKK